MKKLYIFLFDKIQLVVLRKHNKGWIENHSVVKLRNKRNLQHLTAFAQGPLLPPAQGPLPPAQGPLLPPTQGPLPLTQCESILVDCVCPTLKLGFSRIYLYSLHNLHQYLL